MVLILGRLIKSPSLSRKMNKDDPSHSWEGISAPVGHSNLLLLWIPVTIYLCLSYQIICFLKMKMTVWISIHPQHLVYSRCLINICSMNMERGRCGLEKAQWLRPFFPVPSVSSTLPGSWWMPNSCVVMKEQRVYTGRQKTWVRADLEIAV